MSLSSVRSETALRNRLFSSSRSFRRGGSTGEKTEDRVAREGKMSSFLERLHQVRDDLDQRREDPWRKKLEAAVRGMETIGSAALLDLLRVPATTGNARRLALNMRSLGFILLKSRRILSGGFGNTTARGWTRPVRESSHRLKHGEKVGSPHLNTPIHFETA
jgi:hypothetical protein